MTEQKTETHNIDLQDIATFLNRKKWPLDNNQRQILEEVVFLCVNESFIKDVQRIRKYFIKKHPRIAIPTTSTRQAEAVVRFLYLRHHKKI